MKLLAKMAEDRYQTAAGLERDLRHCLTEWETRGLIDYFPLGEHDTADRLLIPEKLYGRANEIGTLLAAFDRVVQGGAPELVLVSGYSGIGKSSLSMNCTRYWSRSAACLLRASSINTSAIFPIPHWRRLFRALSARCWRRAKSNSDTGVRRSVKPWVRMANLWWTWSRT